MNINCVEMMREIRNKINKEFQEMLYHQKREYIDSRVSKKALASAKESSNKSPQRTLSRR